MTRDEQLKTIKNLNEQIESYRKKTNECIQTVRVAIKSCTELSSEEKKKLQNILYQFGKSNQKIQNLQINQINKKLEKQKGHPSKLDYIALENLVIEEFKDSITEYDKSDIISKIDINPSQTIINELNEYLHYQKAIKNTYKEIERIKKIKTTEKKENITQSKNENKIESEQKKSKNQNIQITQLTNSSKKDMSHQEIINYIANKNKTKTTLNCTKHRYLDVEDKKLIADYIGIEEYSQPLLFSEISEMLLDQNTISILLTKFKNYDKALIKTKKVDKPTLEELLEMARITHSNIVEHLLEENIVSTNKNMLIKNTVENRKNPLTYLEKYEKAYNIYINYYNSLSNEEKEAEKSQVKKNIYKYEELNINNFYLLTPEMLKNRINTTIKEKMINEYAIYGNNRDFIIASKIEKATTLMNNNEIKELYNSIKNNREKAIEYYSKFNNSLPKKPNWYTDLQYNFCNAIYYKQTKNLSEEELKKLNKDKELYKICTEILGEEPLFMTEKYIEEKPQTKTVMEEAAKANERFFNISKIEQTFNRINGNWKKFEEKLEAMLETNSTFEEKEIAEELKGMFR